MINQSAINQYCSYFEEQLKKVSMVEERLYKKILLVTMLDTRARVRRPNVQSNKDRFASLIRDCANWPDGNRISLPQLSFLLQTFPATGSKLKREVDERLDSWQYGRIYRLSEVDPWADELKPFATITDEQKLLDNCRHADLLYAYRNHLVHEFRESGYGMGISDDDTTPYYHRMTELQGRDTWELIYPIEFFIYITGCSLDSLKRYLLDNDYDPYSSYKFASIWKRR
jgi:hypothetical protein